MNFLKKIKMPARMKDEKGQTMVEYALIIALIALGLVVGLTALEGGITAAYGRVVAALGLAV